VLALTGSKRGRAVRVQVMDGSSVAVRGLRLVGGVSTVGSGVYAEASRVELYGVTVADCLADGEYAQGAGVYVASGTVTITGTTFINTIASGPSARGGGLFVNDGTVSITGTTFVNTTASGTAYAYGGRRVHSSEHEAARWCTGCSVGRRCML
jgi:fibronectin-binding autotransporter adhesin